MSTKKKNIAEILSKQPDILKTSAKIAESFKAYDRIGNQFKYMTAYNELFGSIHTIQSLLVSPAYELQKSLAPIYELSDKINTISKALQINDHIKSINALSELQHKIQTIANNAAELWHVLHPILEEIDQQVEQVELEKSKLPAKMNTIPEVGSSVEEVEKAILRLGIVKDTCDQLINILKACERKYEAIDAIDLEEDIEKIHVLINGIEGSRVNCERLLADKNVQLEFLQQSDEEYAKKMTQISSERMNFHIFFPDYIEDFLKLEEELVANNYLDSHLAWLKDKQTLAAFIEKLNECRYFRRTTTSLKIYRKQIKDYFNHRYLIDITEQFKPSKLQKFSLPATFPIKITPK